MSWLGGGVLVALLGQLLAGPLLQALHVPEDVYPLAVLYLRIYLLGMPVILLYNFEAAIFRSIGDTKTPLLVLAISGGLNVIGNLFFVIVIKMTIDGVATATVLSNAVSSLLLFRKLRRADGAIQVVPRQLRISWPVFGRILRIGLPAGIQSAMFSVSNIVIQSAINQLGTDVMAASSAAFNIEILAYYVLNAFSQACTTFVGQNYGAGQIKRCRRTLLLCILEDAIATAAAIGLVLLSGRFLLSLFNREPAVIELGYLRLRIVFSAYLFTMLYETMSAYLRGFGRSLVPAILTVCGVCGVRIAWIYTAFPHDPTFRTILNVYPISLAATAALVFIALLLYHPARRFSANKPTPAG